MGANTAVYVAVIGSALWFVVVFFGKAIWAARGGVRCPTLDVVKGNVCRLWNNSPPRPARAAASTRLVVRR